MHRQHGKAEGKDWLLSGKDLGSLIKEMKIDLNFRRWVKVETRENLHYLLIKHLISLGSYTKSASFWLSAPDQIH